MAKVKKLKYKFNARALGGLGEIVISGLGGVEEDIEMVPGRVVTVLDNYGFTLSDDEECSVTFGDSCCPGECSVGEDIECITQIVNMQLCSELQRKRNGEVKVTFTCAFDELNSGRGETVDGAMRAAHKIWNRVHRPINGVTIDVALREVLNEINEDR